MSRRVLEADSARRRRLHIAAVFGCNFVNHLWAIADRLLGDDGMSFDLLEPLLRETLDKAVETGPRSGQTGPARRGDTRVMESHKKMLPPELADLYSRLSESIIKMYRQ